MDQTCASTRWLVVCVLSLGGLALLSSAAEGSDHWLSFVPDQRALDTPECIRPAAAPAMGSSQGWHGSGAQSSSLFAAGTSPLEALERSTASSTAVNKSVSETATAETAIWASTYAGISRFQDHSDLDGFSAQTYGFIVGAGLNFGDDFLLGLLFGYERSNYDLNHHGGNGAMSSIRFGPYAVKRFGAWFVNANLTAAMHRIHYRRYTFGIFENRGTFATCDLTLATTIGREINLSDATMITPFGSLIYVRQSQKDYRESGFIPTGVSFDASHDAALTSRLGMRLRHIVKAGRMVMIFNLDGSWSHRCLFGGGGVLSTGTISGIGVGARNYFTYGANVVVPFSKSTSLVFAYNGRFGSDYVASFGSLSLRIAL